MVEEVKEEVKEEEKKEEKKEEVVVQVVEAVVANDNVDGAKGMSHDYLLKQYDSSILMFRQVAFRKNHLVLSTGWCSASGPT